MENLFRLMLLRPAVSQDPEQPSIELDQESAYQDALRAAVAAGGGRKGVEAGSAEFAASADFVQGLGDTPLGQRQKLLDDRRKCVDELVAEHEALRGAATYTRVLRAQHVKGQLAREGEEGGEPDERAGALQISTPYAELAQTLVAAPDVVLSARAGFTPVALAELGFVLEPTAADRLSQSTQTVLKQRGIDLGTRADDALPVWEQNEDGDWVET